MLYGYYCTNYAYLREKRIDRIPCRTNALLLLLCLPAIPPLPHNDWAAPTHREKSVSTFGRLRLAGSTRGVIAANLFDMGHGCWVVL